MSCITDYTACQGGFRLKMYVSVEIQVLKFIGRKVSGLRCIESARVELKINSQQIH
jgi:hypothetical protein